MTVALFAAAFGALLWPPDGGAARRIGSLRAARRLAPGRAENRDPRTRIDHYSTLARRRGRQLLRAAVGPAALTVIVVASASGAGSVALTEFGGVALSVGFVTVLLIRRAISQRRRVMRAAEISLALVLVAGELEAGAPLSGALVGAGAVGGEIERHLAGGLPIDPDDPLARLVLAARVSARTGLPLAELLARVRADLAAGAATRRELSTLLAGPRASAAVLTVLPVLGIALGSAMGAHPLTTLVSTGPGRLLLCVGVLFDSLGVVWTAGLIARAQR